MKKKQMQILALGLCLFAIPFLLHLSRQTEHGQSAGEEGKDIMERPMTRDGQILLRLADNQKPEHPTSVACDYFASLVEERTEGRIRIIPYHSARLGDEKTTLSQLRYGGIDMVRTSIALLTDYNPELTVLEMPYIYRDSEHMWQVLDSELGDYFLKSLEKSGLEGLCWFDAGARNFYTADRPVFKLSDLEGLYIRVQQSSFMVDLVSILGANPINLPYESVSVQLKQGRIDGAENNFPSYISTGHYLSAPYMIMDGHTRIPEMIVINQIVLNGLDPKDQEILRQAAADASLFQRSLWESEEQKAMEQFLKSGGQVTYPEDPEEFMKKVQPLYNTYAWRYQELLEAIQAIGRTEPYPSPVVPGEK